MKKNFITVSALIAAVSLAPAAFAEAVTETATEALTAEVQTEGAETETVTITDSFGEVEVPVNPERVVSLDNRTFETLADWGIELAAVPKGVMASDSPYVADEDVQDIGNHREPNLEIIAAVDPELVIVGQRFAGYYEDIKALVPQASVISLDIDVSETAEDAGDNLVNGLKENTEILGQIFDKEEEAEALNAELDEAIAAASENYDPEKTVMAVNVSAGEIGFIAPNFGRVFGPRYDVLGWTPALTVENATTNHEGDEVSVEAIANSNPDVLMVLDRDAAIMADATPAVEVLEESEAMKNVTAVVEGNVIYAPADTYVNESIQTYIEMLNSVAEAFAE